MKIDSNTSFIQSTNDFKQNVSTKKNSTPISPSNVVSISSNSKSKIESLKEQIKNGTYKVNPQSLADKILSKSTVSIDS
jgi:anti-sigma28 factor (negative regulator of flagellin synthesis)